MSAKQPEPQKLFTVGQVNAMLPLVKAIVKDLSDLAREVIERRQRLTHLLSGRDDQPGDPYHDELAQVEEELSKDAIRLRDYVDELRGLGVEPKDCVEGLVDFPALLDGRTVYLCWRLGEPELLFWHELDAGFQGRQPLSPAFSIPNPTKFTH